MPKGSNPLIWELWKMKLKSVLTIVLFMASVFFYAVSDADAARFGGGRSFGSKPSMQRSTTAPTQQKPAMANAAPGAAAQKPGLLGGMGGMLGGLLAGTLLGSLLFGGGFNGGGFMDLLLIALVAFVGFKLFARFRASRNAAPATAGGPSGMSYQAKSDEGPMQRQSENMWGALKDNAPQAAAVSEPSVPAGFDTEEFLRGAKMAFTRLQNSWDKRDLADIEQFAGESVMKEVKAQFETDPNPGKTEILLVNAQLLSVIEEENVQTASVFFDVLMREEAGRDTNQVREVWHFVRPKGDNGMWKLDGIQQVE